MQDKDLQIIAQATAHDASQIAAAYIRAANGAVTEDQLPGLFVALHGHIYDCVVEAIAAKTITSGFQGATVTPAPVSAPVPAPSPAAVPAPAPAPMVPAPQAVVPGSLSPAQAAEEAAVAEFFADVDGGRLDANWYDNRTFKGQPSNTPHFKRKRDGQAVYVRSKFPRAAWIDEGFAARGIV